MCGLVGFSSTTNSNVDKLQLLMYMNSVERGEDNTGIFTPELGVKKDNDKAKLFLTKNKLPESKLFIGHVRKGSVGGKLAKNSHPFEFDNIVLAHNGTLENHWKMLTDADYKLSDYDVDSQVLAQLIDDDSKQELEEGKDINFTTLTKFLGEAALLFHDKRNPNRLYAFRTLNRPLFYGNLNDSMYISSLEDSLKIIGCVETKQFLSSYLYIIEDGKILKNTHYTLKTKPIVTHHYGHQQGVIDHCEYNRHDNYQYQSWLDKRETKLLATSKINNEVENFQKLAEKNVGEFVGKWFRCVTNYKDQKYGTNTINITKGSWYLILDHSKSNNWDLEIIDDAGECVDVNKFFFDYNSDIVKDYVYLMSDIKRTINGIPGVKVFDENEIAEVIDPKKGLFAELYSKQAERTFDVGFSEFRPATKEEIENFEKAKKLEEDLNAESIKNRINSIVGDIKKENSEAKIINFDQDKDLFKDDEEEIEIVNGEEINNDPIEKDAYESILDVLDNDCDNILELSIDLQHKTENYKYSRGDIQETAEDLRNRIYDLKDFINQCYNPEDLISELEKD